MKLVNFQSENLAVDYISFNITNYTDPEPIANYLSDSFGFNLVLKETFKFDLQEFFHQVSLPSSSITQLLNELVKNKSEWVNYQS